ncbi:MAG TPA: DUF2189 domain-containing protein [Kiloniellaceae bacterium]|nr:DUF2189 domain-containing protein [Kiloniellaceae bacterium]HIP77211.1 DUF2189 domain-containing protein [Kiloniellaceae bacterium]
MTATHNELGSGFPPVRRLELERPWAWLSAGWQDMWQAPGVSLTYGAIFTLVSFVITAGVLLADLTYLLLPLVAGFMLVGPMLAVGLYETSRRLETGAPVTLGAALFVATRSPMRLAFLGVTLMIVLLVWMRLATLLFALFLGTTEVPPMAEIVPTLLFTPNGLSLLIVGSAAGALLATLVFAISVISVPLLMERDIDFMTAVITSIQSVLRNPKPMLLWAWLVALLTAGGLVTLYLGLVVTFPLVGHATWHAYRDTIGR